LIDGIVYISSPVRLLPHGRPHNHLNTWIGTYEAATIGVIASDNATVRLGADEEPQPDVLLMIEPSRGGVARIAADGYLEGAPELAGEVAASSTSIDLHRKLRAYQRSGVREYIVWRVRDGALDWFVLREGAYVPLAPGEDGLLRSATFPGLWLDPAALLRGDLARVLAVVQEGCRTPEHAAFVAKLAADS
jgi:Uma2 family endonuclease